MLIVSESVRAADACGVPTAGCATTPFTNALLPDRFGFTQMRSLDSTTAVSLAVLWAGLKPTASREQLHKAPLLWEYAHAAGFDTGYWTSQNLFFANAGKWLEGLPISRFVSATDLATNPKKRKKLTPAVSLVTPAMVKRLEGRIDDLVAAHPLPEVFIVPGANPGSAALDMARGVIRRAERRVVELEATGREVNEEVRRYLNRLSDLVFVLARWQAGEAEPASREG